MPDDAKSHGLWRLTAPPPPPTFPLNDNLRADVTIIGGGYTGLSAALHLAKAGTSVVLLEAHEIGFGGAGRNVGLVNAGLWITPETVLERLGTTYGERLVNLLSNAPRYVFDLIERHDIACEAEQSGTLHCALGRHGLQEIETRARQWQRRDAPVVLLNAAETAVKTGSDAYAGALLDKRAGTIQPLAYARGLASAAIRASAFIFSDSAAIAAERQNGRWKVSTSAGSVSSEWIIVATDAYATGPFSDIRSEQVHLPYFNFATAPLPEGIRTSILPERQGAWDTKKILSSFRLDHAGRLIFGSVGSLRSLGLSAHRSWATRSLRRIFPQVGDVTFESEWYGMIGMTTDALPRFHKLDDKVVAISGYNGRGIAPGTVFGSILSSYILGNLPEHAMPLPQSPVEFIQFREIKEKFYEFGSLAAHLVSREY